MQTGTQAIDRAAQLLVLVVESEESSSVGELAEAAGLPKSTVSRAVSALERQGLVQRSGVARRHPPGPGAARPGPPRRQRRRHRRAVRARRWSGWASHRRDDRPGGGRARRLGAVPRPGRQPPLPGHHQLGRPPAAAPLHRRRQGAAGVRRGPPAGAARSSGSRPTRSPTATALAAELETVRARGYATAVGELEPGLVAVAAPGARCRRPGGGGDQHLGAGSSGCEPDRLDELGELLVEGDDDAVRRGWDTGARRREQHDQRRDPAGAVRQHAGRQRAGGQGADQRGPGAGHGPRDAALRRADPVAGGGRRPLRARRLLRARRC